MNEEVPCPAFTEVCFPTCSLFRRKDCQNGDHKARKERETKRMASHLSRRMPPFIKVDTSHLSSWVKRISLISLFHFLLCFISSGKDQPQEGPQSQTVVAHASWKIRAFFWRKREYDAARYQKHLIQQDGSREVEMYGDGGVEFQPELPSSPFCVVKKKKQSVYHMFESGLGLPHDCDFGRVMKRNLVKPFLGKDQLWVTEGKKGFEVELNFVLYGVVEQSPSCHWVHITSKSFKIPVPTIFHGILGNEFVVEGHFAMVGEKPSRMKRTRIRFVEKNKGALKANVPANTRIKINWKEAFVPEPISGLWWWGVYIEVAGWKAWS